MLALPTPSSVDLPKFPCPFLSAFVEIPHIAWLHLSDAPFFESVCVSCALFWPIFVRFTLLSFILPGAVCAAAWAQREFPPGYAYGAARAYGIHGW